LHLWDLTKCTRLIKYLYFNFHIKFNIHFILSFKYHVVNDRRWSERPKYVACVDGANDICCGWWRYVYQFLIWYTTRGWILQKNDNFKIIHQHSPTYAIVTFWTVRHNSDFFLYHVHMDKNTRIKKSPTEIQTRTQWNLIGRSMTGRPHLLSPSSILSPPSSLCAFIPARKNSLPDSKM